MTIFEAFIWGFTGSIAVEVVTVVQIFHGGRPFPKRYSRLGFYVVRVLLARF